MSFGGGPLFGGGWYHPGGSYGPWAGCGCSSFAMIIAGVLLVFAGCARNFGF